MLINFKVSNYKSFKDEASLSLVAGPNKEHRDTNVILPTVGTKPIPILRSAVIYGANASGKTNLLSALATMERIVRHSARGLDELHVSPFRFDGAQENDPTTFEAIFISDGVQYQYGFAATADRIVREWLYAWPRGRVQTWFRRDEAIEGEVRFGGRLSGDRDVWRRATRPDALLLSTAVALNSKQLQPVYEWFRSRLRVAGVYGWSPDYSFEWCQDDRKERILRFLRAADLAISDIRVVETDVDLPAPRQPLGRPVANKARKLRLLHDVPGGPSTAELDFAEESLGTQKIFALSGPWLDTLANGRVVVLDELHGNLHPTLVRFLIGCFHDPTINAAGAQLIFTTHETAILNQDVFRRDQVWFCQRNERQESALYPLTDFRPRKGVDNLERAYLGGRYGGVPFVEPANLLVPGK